MGEASLRGGVPVTAGWFVVNVRETRWVHNRMRSLCRFGGEGEAHFDDLAGPAPDIFAKRRKLATDLGSIRVASWLAELTGRRIPTAHESGIEVRG